MPLSIVNNLTSYTLAAGEPFVVEIQLLDSAGRGTDIADTAMYLSFYEGSTRALVLDYNGARAQYQGERLADETGEFFRFAFDGFFSEGMYNKPGVKVELSRRFLNGRQVIATGNLAVLASASSLPSLIGEGIADTAIRVTIKANSTLGGVPVITQQVVSFNAGATPIPDPEPVFTTQPSIAPASGPVGTTFTASNGVASNATGYARRWLLGTTAIGTGATVTPNAAGSLTLEVTATGPGGTKKATSAAVTVSVANGTPTPTPTGAPTYTVSPSIVGTPRVGQPLSALTYNDGTYTGTVSNREYLVNGVSKPLSYVLQQSDQTASLTYRVTVSGASGTTPVTRTSPAVIIAAAAVSAFKANPSIAGDANRTAGDVFAYDPGVPPDGQTIVRTMLSKNGNETGQLSGGSGTFSSAGTYLVRSYTTNDATIAESNTVTVVAAVAGTMTPPTFYFAQDRTPGTNPPEVYWDDPDDTIYATDSLMIEGVAGGSNYSKTIPMDISSRSLHEFLVSEWADLAAGPFSVRGRYMRTKDEDGNTIATVYSDWGPTLTDTLAAKTLPPPTTVFDVGNKTKYLIVENDPLYAKGINSGYPTPGLVTVARTDKRYAEFSIVSNNSSTDRYFVFGIAASNTVIDAEAFGNDFPFVGWRDTHDKLVAGDTVTVITTPTAIEVKKNGVPVYSGTHSLASYKLLFSPSNDCRVQLNTGPDQKYPPADTTFIRYN